MSSDFHIRVIVVLNFFIKVQEELIRVLGLILKEVKFKYYFPRYSRVYNVCIILLILNKDLKRSIYSKLKCADNFKFQSIQNNQTLYYIT